MFSSSFICLSLNHRWDYPIDKTYAFLYNAVTYGFGLRGLIRKDGSDFLEQTLQSGNHFFEIKLIRHTYFPQKPFLAEDP